MSTETILIPGQPDPSQAKASFHFIVTLQWGPGPGSTFTSSYANTVTATAGTPRSEVFARVLAVAREQLSAPEGAVILFFSLEPEDLAVTASTAGE